MAPESPHSDSFGAAQPCCHLRSGRTDRDVVVQEEIENKKEYLESVKASNSQMKGLDTLEWPMVGRY